MRLAPGLLLLALLTPGCSGGERGAVVVRWKLIEGATGTQPASCHGVDVPAGACCGVIHGATDSRAVLVDHIRLRAERSVDGGEVLADCPSCCFSCAPLEHTTQFELPPGDYRLSLEALRCGQLVGYTPPAQVRTVNAGEITNLSAVEILIPPETDTPATCAGGLDEPASCVPDAPDGGD